MCSQYSNTNLAATNFDPLSLHFSGEDGYGTFHETVSSLRKEDWSNAYEELRNNREAVIAAVSAYPMVLSNLPTELRSDEEIVMAAVSVDGAALQFASRDLRDNEKVVKAAKKAGGHALRFASTRLKDFWARKTLRDNIPDITEDDLEERVGVILARAMPEYSWAC